MWTTFPSGEGKYMTGYKVTITHPNGNTEDVNLQSYVADGTSWFTYIPHSIGEWKFEFDFAGEYFPAGYYANGQYSLLALEPFQVRFSTPLSTAHPPLPTL